MVSLPLFIAPARFDDPDAALAQVQRDLPTAASPTCATSLQRFVAGADAGAPVRACYPFVRVRTDTVARADSRLSYGFVAGPGTYETTLTRPDLFGDYYLEQFRLLLKNHGVALEVGTSTQPIPVHFSLAEHDHVEGTPRAPSAACSMRDLFDLPDLAAMDDGIANGTHEPAPGEAQPLALFTAPRVDYSLHRLRHYTGTAPEHFQNFVLFTNYQFYIDEFVASATSADGRRRRRATSPSSSRATSSRAAPGCAAEPGDAPAPRRRACRRCRPTTWCAPDGSGITMVNIGVGPANAKTITDHIAVLRPHAWLMLGHCAGLRNTQQLGDYVLAHGYVREDHVLDEELPLWVPIPALAEVQVALEQAVAEVTQLAGLRAEAASCAPAPSPRTDNRNWELLPHPRAGAPLQPEPRDRARHGERHHRRQRLPLPRALRHAAVRQRQAAARRDQAARHGQHLLPRARRPAPAHRHARDGAAARQAARPAAQPQAAQLRRGGVPVARGPRVRRALGGAIAPSRVQSASRGLRGHGK